MRADAGQLSAQRPGAVALLLAAGLSERMGALKAGLRWGEHSLLEYQVAQLRAAGIGEVVVVLGFAAERARALLPSEPWVRWVYNPDYRLGRSSSIRAGAGVLGGEVAAVLVVAVDQPCPAPVAAELLRAAEARPGLVYVPVYQGRRGHPVLLDGSLLPELRAVSEASQGLRAVVQRHAGRLVEVPVDSETVLWNLNRPEDYRRAHRAFFGTDPPG